MCHLSILTSVNFVLNQNKLILNRHTLSKITSKTLRHYMQQRIFFVVSGRMVSEKQGANMKSGSHFFITSPNIFVFIIFVLTQLSYGQVNICKKYYEVSQKMDPNMGSSSGTSLFERISELNVVAQDQKYKYAPYDMTAEVVGFIRKNLNHPDKSTFPKITKTELYQLIRNLFPVRGARFIVESQNVEFQRMSIADPVMDINTRWIEFEIKRKMNIFMFYQHLYKSYEQWSDRETYEVTHFFFTNLKESLEKEIQKQVDSLNSLLPIRKQDSRLTVKTIIKFITSDEPLPSKKEVFELEMNIQEHKAALERLDEVIKSNWQFLMHSMQKSQKRDIKFTLYLGNQWRELIFFRPKVLSDEMYRSMDQKLYPVISKFLSLIAMKENDMTSQESFQSFESLIKEIKKWKSQDIREYFLDEKSVNRIYMFVNNTFKENLYNLLDKQPRIKLPQEIAMVLFDIFASQMSSSEGYFKPDEVPSSLSNYGAYINMAIARKMAEGNSVERQFNHIEKSEDLRTRVLFYLKLRRYLGIFLGEVDSLDNSSETAKKMWKEIRIYTLPVDRQEAGAFFIEVEKMKKEFGY